MARFIPVDGPVGPEEPLANLIFRHFGFGSRPVSFENLEATGEVILSHLDVTDVNSAATRLAGGKTIYGDAVVFRDAERFGG